MTDTATTMTIPEMVDEWSRMTPRQREFCARLVDVASRRPVMGDGERVLAAVAASPLDEHTRKQWDGFFWPFKFGGSE